MAKWTVCIDVNECEQQHTEVLDLFRSSTDLNSLESTNHYFPIYKDTGKINVIIEDHHGIIYARGIIAIFPARKPKLMPTIVESKGRISGQCHRNTCICHRYNDTGLLSKYRNEGK
ncbi:hypothetical protein DICVIV_11655 [Dictyocaulus viviparus]|uniref:Uncharacterized protein n=1 Tax=Dictyocaulus viviparus TaxID=29172 RepID=A0A0D8XF87_DICVI|nr:hypothetical protein DICVIV_11655 [Dictyocaulus viviparus]